MPFRYIPFDTVTEDTPEVEANINRKRNLEILRSGVVGLACLDVRPVTRGERLDYEQFAPHGSMLTSAEVYENGAMNIFVRTKLDYKQIGVILVRPLWETIDKI